jgi:hypothetical protein
MLKLPKVIKDAARALTRMDSAKAVVAGAAFALGLTLAGVPTQDAQAGTAPSVQATTTAPQASLLLLPAQQALDVNAAHASHASHSSHSSHSSHASHVSSAP